jgi:hypothetical protein
MGRPQKSPPCSATAITSYPRACTRHDLARLHVGERRELVTQHGGALEIKLFCCAVHVCAEANGHVLCTPVENHGGRLDVAGIGGRVDEPRARRGTAADLVFEAGTRAVREKRVLAAAQAKELVQLVQRLVHCTGRRVRAEQAPGELARAPIKG